MQIIFLLIVAVVLLAWLLLAWQLFKPGTTIARHNRWLLLLAMTATAGCWWTDSDPPNTHISDTLTDIALGGTIYTAIFFLIFSGIYRVANYERRKPKK